MVLIFDSTADKCAVRCQPSLEPSLGFPIQRGPTDEYSRRLKMAMQPSGGSELIKRNKEEADQILKELGVTVDWWPSP